MPLRTRSQAETQGDDGEVSLRHQQVGDQQLPASGVQSGEPLKQSSQRTSLAHEPKARCLQGNPVSAGPYGQRGEPTQQMGLKATNQREGDPGTAGHFQRYPSAASREVSCADTLGADLDLAERDDDFPTVADCPNLGSFAEESPPRSLGNNPAPFQPNGSPRTSRLQGYPIMGMHAYPQPYHRFHQRQQRVPSVSPPSSHFVPQQNLFPPPAQAPYGYHHQPFSHRPPPADLWPEETEHGKAVAKLQGPPVQKPRIWEASSPPEAVATPKKVGAYEDRSQSISGQARTLERSPFRSPPPRMDKGSAKKYKRSPLFQGTPGGISNYGSFEHLGVSLEEFSPMGPPFGHPFNAFGDDSPSIRMADRGHDPELSLDPRVKLNPSPAKESSSTGDAVSVDRPIIQQRRAIPLSASPFSSFIGGFSPMGGARRFRGSPVHLEQRDLSAGLHPHELATPNPLHQRMMFPGSVQSQARRPMTTSPVTSTQASATNQHRSWRETPKPSSSGLFRLEIGDVGVKPEETRKGFEGINNVIRGRQPASIRRPSPPGKKDTPGSDAINPANTAPASKRFALNTPIGPFAGTHHGSAHSQTSRQTHFQTASRPDASRQTPSRRTDKENSTPGSSQRRSPCNCKKSRCLKLYCECYAAERYCEGCNCGDCQNIAAFELIRSKAMKDTRAKNPNAFKQRVVSKLSPSAGHNMGCKCKRSECLKKYCECFQAGVMCGSKCKCEKCQNFVGSQALIDKRRKIKDHRGAEFAMRIADEAWKGSHVPSNPNPNDRRNPNDHRNAPLPSPANRHPGISLPPHLFQPSPAPAGVAPHPYIASVMMRSHLGSSALPMPPVTPGYPRSSQRIPQPHERRLDGPYGDPMLHRTPTISTPQTPVLRLGHDIHPRQKERKPSLGGKEEKMPLFGKNPRQPKTTALKVFAFLSREDLYNASLVCKCWNDLSSDELQSF